MKVLSIWQPWAELIASGKKDEENREWPTDYRGPLIIQAGKKWDLELIKAELEARLAEGHIDEGDAPELEAMKKGLGHAVCVVDLVDCIKASDSTSPWAGEGDGYVFVLANPRRVHVKVKGRQKLYSPSDEEREAIELELGVTRRETGGSYAIEWGDLVDVKPRTETNEKAKEAKKRERKGALVDSEWTQDELDAVKIQLRKVSPHGSLPMDEDWMVKMVSGGKTLYDSERMGDDGRFDEEAEAHAHGVEWRRAQVKRRQTGLATKAQRLFAMPGRLDEIDKAHEALDAHRKRAAEFVKECKDDFKTIRDEQRTPEITVRLKDGEFVVEEAPSLSDGTVGRRWWGSKDA